MRFQPVLAGLLLSATASSALAQSTYATGRDTLRFREVTRLDVRVVTPQGELPMAMQQDATIAIARQSADTVRAWYQALSLGLTGPAGEQKPATDSALNAPFTLRVDSRGRVNVLATPKFPASFEGVTDLSRQFDDFFLRLPAKPLKIGLTWTDTSTTVDSTATKLWRWRSVASYRVERDTVVAGVPAVVISMKQALLIRSAGPIPNPPARMESDLSGTEEGVMVFAPRTGRLLGRRRTGRIDGDILMNGDFGQMAMKQSISYTSTTDALK